MLLRGRIRERETRRKQNFEKMMLSKERTIHERSQANDIRTSMSLRAKRSQKDIGEITQMSEKLRGLCLQRGTHLE